MNDILSIRLSMENVLIKECQCILLLLIMIFKQAGFVVIFIFLVTFSRLFKSQIVVLCCLTWPVMILDSFVIFDQSLVAVTIPLWLWVAVLLPGPPLPHLRPWRGNRASRWAVHTGRRDTETEPWSFPYIAQGKIRWVQGKLGDWEVSKFSYQQLQKNQHLYSAARSFIYKGDWKIFLQATIKHHITLGRRWRSFQSSKHSDGKIFIFLEMFYKIHFKNICCCWVSTGLTLFNIQLSHFFFISSTQTIFILHPVSASSIYCMMFTLSDTFRPSDRLFLVPALFNQCNPNISHASCLLLYTFSAISDMFSIFGNFCISIRIKKENSQCHKSVKSKHTPGISSVYLLQQLKYLLKMTAASLAPYLHIFYGIKSHWMTVVCTSMVTVQTGPASS